MRNSRSPTRFLTTIPFLLLAGFIAGCVNFDPHVDSTEFYLLGGDARKSVDPIKVRVALRDVHLVDHLAHSQIVETAGSGEVRYLPGHRWAGQLDSMIAQVIISELEHSVEGLYATAGDSPEADYNLDITILQFNRLPGGGVAVALEYRIVDGPSRILVKEGRTSSTSGSEGSSIEQSVRQLEASLREAVKGFAPVLDPSA